MNNVMNENEYLIRMESNQPNISNHYKHSNASSINPKIDTSKSKNTYILNNKEFLPDDQNLKITCNDHELSKNK